VLSLDEESFFYNGIMPCQCSPPVTFDSSALGQGQNMTNPAQTGRHHRDECGDLTVQAGHDSHSIAL